MSSAPRAANQHLSVLNDRDDPRVLAAASGEKMDVDKRWVRLLEAGAVGECQLCNFGQAQLTLQRC